jgi:hypothetical protein
MKKNFIVSILLLVGFLVIFESSMQAQSIVGLSVVGYNQETRTAGGFSGTYIDYSLYDYYDPWVFGLFFFQNNPEAPIQQGGGYGVNSYLEGTNLIGYTKSFFTEDYRPIKTYCTFSTHKLVAYYPYYSGGNTYWNDPYRISWLSPVSGGNQNGWSGFPFTIYRIIPRLYHLGSTEVCITTPPDCVPLSEANGQNLVCPTPSPTPTITPTPTPTPSPSPTPVNPTVNITEAGFTGDRKIRQFKVSGQPYIDEPDGSTPTWKSNNNPEFPVAYRSGISPTMFAKFSISPALTGSRSAKIQVKKGLAVVTSFPIDVNLIGSAVSVSGFNIPFSGLERDQFIKMGKYEFTWEISFDGGTTWVALRKKSKHEIHWLWDNPANESTFSPFVNSADEPFNGLFDLALEWSTGKVKNDEYLLDNVVKSINKAVSNRVAYNPGIPPTGGNPLGILGSGGGQAVCQDNALILTGLLKSIGFSDAQTNFHWGGNNATSQRHFYCKSGGCVTPSPGSPLGNRATMQTKRDQLGCPGCAENLPRNPSFAYHATVDWQGVSYDPSYGLVENNIQLLTALKVNPGQPPTCVHDSEATALLVSRPTFGNASFGANVDSLKTCEPVLNASHSSAKLFRFDGNGGADLAIVNGSTGKWIVQDEETNETQTPPLGFNPNTDGLAPADYDGDGITDPAVWYGNGDYIIRTSLDYYKVINPRSWYSKAAADKAVPGDYDGDGLSDVATWRASDGKWFVERSSDYSVFEVQWGLGSLGDIPVPGDYDRDGKTDFAVWRATTGIWYVLKSSDWSFNAVYWGMSGDIPVQGDYDGDGMTDYAVVRPSTGFWYMLESENGYQYRSYQGPVLAIDDRPVPADYNGDSKTDVAVWFKTLGTWHIVDSQTGEIREQRFGETATNDVPVISASVFR